VKIILSVGEGLLTCSLADEGGVFVQKGQQNLFGNVHGPDDLARGIALEKVG
jgi:hypothetical protein